MEQEHVCLERNLIPANSLLEPDPLVAAIGLLRRAHSEITLLDELHDLAAEHCVRIDQACEGAVQEALTEAGQGPRSGLLERGRPVAVEIPRTHRLVQQCLRLERRDRPTTEALAGARMPCAEVDGLEPVRPLHVREDHEAVSAPDLVPGGLIGVGDLDPELHAVGGVEVSAQCALGDLDRDAPPGQPELHLLAQLPTRLLETPHQGASVQPRRLPTLFRPLRDLLSERPAAGPFRVRLGHHEGELGRVLNGRAVGREEHLRDTRTLLELFLDERLHRRPDLRVLVE